MIAGGGNASRFCLEANDPLTIRMWGFRVAAGPLGEGSASETVDLMASDGGKSVH
jgi:hypothetical protein